MRFVHLSTKIASKVAIARRSTSTWFHAARMVLTLIVLCGTCVHSSAAVEAPSPEKKETAPPKTPLAPEVEAKLKEFVDKVKVEKVKAWDLRMKKEIEDVTKVTGLGEEGGKSLEAPAKRAVEAAVDSWASKSGDMLRKQLSLMPSEQAVNMLDQTLAQVAQVARSDWSGEVILPFAREDWIKALHQTLTPDQEAAWDKAQADRKESVEKEMGDILKRGADKIHEAQMQEILSECKGIESELGFPHDRSAKLEDLGKNVVDQTTEMWRKRVEKMLLSMEDDQRHQFTNNGNIFIGTNEEESPIQQTTWKEGVAGLLTADETTRLQTAREARKAKRAHVMGQIMLMLLDEKIAFTEAQRQRLEPIADRLTKNVPELFAEGGGNGYYSYAPPLFLAAATKATDAELKPILDDVQLKRWRHLSNTESVVPDVPDADKSKPEENSEPEDVEKAISNFLYEKTEKERKHMIEASVLKAEDAARVAGLNTEVAAQLQAAARGAAEEYLTAWKWFTEQQIRSQLQDVTPQNVQQRLDSLQDYFFQRNYGLNNRPSIWDETVKVELTAKQQESWQKETDARTVFRDQAITSLVLEEFNRKYQLTPEQRGKLEPLIAKTIHDYSADFVQIFSPYNPVPWFMEGVYLLMPFAGVPDADLKAILSKDQVDRWNGSPECSNATNLWQSVQQIHNQRVKAK